MSNNIEIELFDDLKAVCKQARDELCAAYFYFDKISDYNGICILLREIATFDDLFITLDLNDPRYRDYEIRVPSIYEWGFYNGPHYEEARAKADEAVLNAVEQKKSMFVISSSENTNSDQKLYIKNGSFYGYYCYNIYNKCLGWINYSLRNPASNRDLVN